MSTKPKTHSEQDIKSALLDVSPSPGVSDSNKQSATDCAGMPVEMPAEMLPDAGENAVDWRSMTPSERARRAAQIRWARRDSKLVRETPRDATMPDDPDAAVIRELERKALDGDVSAARELRAWRETAMQTGSDIPADAMRLARIIADLDPKTRESFRVWLQAAIADAESPTNAENLEEGLV